MERERVDYRTGPLYVYSIWERLVRIEDWPGFTTQSRQTGRKLGGLGLLALGVKQVDRAVQ